jgi:hypothetical protein
MQATSAKAFDALRICRSLPVWIAPSDAHSAPRDQRAPVPPCIALVALIPPVDFRRKTGRPEAPPRPFSIEPAHVQPERLTLSPRIPEVRISEVASNTKPGKRCGPVIPGLCTPPITPHPGKTDRRGRALGVVLTLPPNFNGPVPLESEPWRGAAVKPSHPAPAEAASVMYHPQAGSAVVAQRPKQGLRELVLPSPRPWITLTIPFESPRGYHVAVPAPAGTAAPHLFVAYSTEIWTSYKNAHIPGHFFLRQSGEITLERQPSLDAARARQQKGELISAVVAFSPGLNEALKGQRVSIQTNTFERVLVENVSPSPMAAIAPLPAVALQEGLQVWTHSINSYNRRQTGTPRLRYGGRLVHSLRLAPAMENEREMSMA